MDFWVNDTKLHGNRPNSSSRWLLVLIGILNNRSCEGRAKAVTNELQFGPLGNNVVKIQALVFSDLRSMPFERELVVRGGVGRPSVRLAGYEWPLRMIRITRGARPASYYRIALWDSKEVAR